MDYRGKGGGGGEKPVVPVGLVPWILFFFLLPDMTRVKSYNMAAHCVCWAKRFVHLVGLLFHAEWAGIMCIDLYTSSSFNGRRNTVCLTVLAVAATEEWQQSPMLSASKKPCSHRFSRSHIRICIYLSHEQRAGEFCVIFSYSGIYAFTRKQNANPAAH